MDSRHTDSSFRPTLRPCARVLFAALLVVWIGGCASAAAAAPPAADAHPPNVVFIYVDDLGWKDAGFMGSPYFHTPHIDELAAQGMVFTNAYANAPNCAPSRAALLTGQYGPRTGIYTVNSSARGRSQDRKLIPTPNTRTLAREAVTIGEVLQDAGYATASIGKWHLGDPPDHGPEAQGFDLNVGGYGVGNPNPFGAYFAPWSNPYLEDVPPGTYLTDHLTDKALAFVARNQEQPFFLYLPYYNVHSPWQAPDSLVRTYEQREEGSHRQIKPTYAAMVERVDANVGRLLAQLDTLNLTEETLVVFTSDNGGHAAATSMAPLRGSKGMLYEGGLRVPLVVRWPQVVAAGSSTDIPVIGVDFFPTLLEVTGTPAPEGVALDGESLVPLLKGSEESLARRSLFWHFPAYLEAYTEAQGRWRTTPAGAVRKGPWKLIEFFEDGEQQLYNLEEDLGEQHDLAQERPQKRRAMQQLLDAWRQSVNAPVPTKPNPDYRADAE